MFEDDQGETDLNGDLDTDDWVVHVYDPATDTAVNTGLAQGLEPMVALSDGRVAFGVSESAQGGTDLTGDGDAADGLVVHVYDPATSTAINTGVNSSQNFLTDAAVFIVMESNAGTDLNGDSDMNDRVVHVFDAATDTTINTGLAWEGGGIAVSVDGDVAFGVREWAQGGTDLNGDGDAVDPVVHVFDPITATSVNTGLAGGADVGLTNGKFVLTVNEFGQGGTDLNGDGDSLDDVVHVYDPATDTAVNTGLSRGNPPVVGLMDSRVAFAVREFSQGETDLNGDGDAFGDEVIHVFNPATATAVNTGLAGYPFAAGTQVLIEVPERDQGETDLNGDGDHFDHVYEVFDPLVS